jgi:hypothetical protein
MLVLPDIMPEIVTGAAELRGSRAGELTDARRWLVKTLAEAVVFLMELLTTAALAGGAALGARVFLLGLDRWPEQPILPHPWLVNLAWLVGFGLQHSGMARAGFKRSWTKVIPPRLERSVYVALSGLLLLGLALTWQPLGGEPWWRLPVWVVGLPLAAVLALALIIWRFDHFGFFGLRQA